jgi:polyisoprenoid-binding protein YceI
MKKIVTVFASVIGLILMVSFTKQTKNQEIYKVNSKESKVEFIGNKKSGYHPGYFPVKSGAVFVSDGKITGGKFIIDIASIKVTDESGERLESTLKSKDFFNTTKFGVAEYEIKNITYKDESNVEIQGELSIKGLKTLINFPAIIRDVNNKTLFAQGFFNIDRTKIGVAGYEDMISTDVQMAVHLFADKQ